MTIQEKVCLINHSPINFNKTPHQLRSGCKKNFLQEWSIFNKSSFQQRLASFNKEFDSFFQNQGIFNEVKNSARHSNEFFIT